jgi:hypothetical protein
MGEADRPRLIGDLDDLAGALAGTDISGGDGDRR